MRRPGINIGTLFNHETCHLDRPQVNWVKKWGFALRVFVWKIYIGARSKERLHNTYVSFGCSHMDGSVIRSSEIIRINSCLEKCFNFCNILFINSYDKWTAICSGN